eukprot:c8131_g1_i1.p1 GENE.c8131_g1_i1~~c8131_g1_i1.p1  ORF type:complete len:292 (-),score=106.12 c8131_g1_i1:41-916(-)
MNKKRSESEIFGSDSEDEKYDDSQAIKRFKGDDGEFDSENIPLPEVVGILDKPLIHIPETLRSKQLKMGIDEAGRGPALGPMVYACAFSPMDYDDALKKIGVGDSKQIKAETRTSLFQTMNSDENIGYIIHALSPNYLSNGMLQIRKRSLNEISHTCAVGLIQIALDQGLNISEVYVDTVGDSVKYQSYLTTQFPTIQFTVTPKADSLFPCVSTASIAAKVTRDWCIAKWTFPENGFVNKAFPGSGYPSDPDTKKWLLEHLDPIFGYPKFVRFSWAPVKLLMQEKAIAVDW